jgi:hypothetical protein
VRRDSESCCRVSDTAPTGEGNPEAKLDRLLEEQGVDPDEITRMVNEAQ